MYDAAEYAAEAAAKASPTPNPAPSPSALTPTPTPTPNPTQVGQERGEPVEGGLLKLTLLSFCDVDGATVQRRD